MHKWLLSDFSESTDKYDWICEKYIFACFLSCDRLILYIKVILVTCSRRIVRYALLTKREVKMAGYWLTSVFRLMDRDKVEVHKNANNLSNL